MSRINKLNSQLREAMRKGDFIKAQSITAQINQTEFHGTKERVQLGSFVSKMTVEEKNKLTENTILIGICSDLIAGYSSDMTAIVKNYDPHSSIDMFDNLVKAGEKAREGNKFFINHKDQHVRELINEVSDDLSLIIDTQVKLKLRRLLTIVG